MEDKTPIQDSNSRPPEVKLSRDKVDLARDGDKVVADKLDAKAGRNREDTEYESDQAYRRITEAIIKVSDIHLKEQRKSKDTLRRRFLVLFTVLLSVQLGSIIVLIALNAINPIPFTIDIDILKLYIVSVFVETLSAMGVMIAFACATKDERKIVEVLNTIVENYQKFTIDKPQSDRKKE